VPDSTGATLIGCRGLEAPDSRSARFTARPSRPLGGRRDRLHGTAGVRKYGTMTAMVIEGSLLLLVILVGGMLGRRVVRRRQARKAREGAIECGLRVISGEHPHLSNRWRHADADLAPGLIEMGFARVEVDHIEPTGRKPALREHWSVSPDTTLLRVHASSGAILEWAVHEDQLEWALREVLPRGPVESQYM
jgi:hypothetical protein